MSANVDRSYTFPRQRKKTNRKETFLKKNVFFSTCCQDHGVSNKPMLLTDSGSLMSGSRGRGLPSQTTSESVQRTVYPAAKTLCRMLGRTRTCDWNVASPIVPAPIA